MTPLIRITMITTTTSMSKYFSNTAAAASVSIPPQILFKAGGHIHCCHHRYRHPVCLSSLFINISVHFCRSGIPGSATQQYHLTLMRPTRNIVCFLHLLPALRRTADRLFVRHTVNACQGWRCCRRIKSRVSCHAMPSVIRAV